MSNTKAKANGHYSLSDFRSEANGEPFVIDVDADYSIEIPRPTSDVLMDVEEATTTREVIRTLAGDRAKELLALVGPEDFTVLKSLADKMQAHFGLGE